MTDKTLNHFHLLNLTMEIHFCYNEIVYICNTQSRGNPTNLNQGEVLTVFCNYEEK